MFITIYFQFDIITIQCRRVTSMMINAAQDQNGSPKRFDRECKNIMYTDF